jgi:Domain of unknown function (DUF6431)
VAILWPYSGSASSYVAAGQRVAVPRQYCPSCGRPLIGWGGYWRWLRAPPLIARIWIRRGRCRGCRRSHALLPDLLLVRRLDGVAVIGQGLQSKVLVGLGLRRVADQLDVPHTTLRSWWRRFRARSLTLLANYTRFAVELDGTSVSVDAGSADRAALEVLGVAWQRARTRFGAIIGGKWSFWSWISGGQALATHTTSPWAAATGRVWMQPSGLGGPAP